MTRRLLLALLLVVPPHAVFALATTTVRAAAEPLSFEISFTKNVCSEPFTGRVFVMLQERPGGEPRFGPNWFRPQPFFAMDVTNWNPDSPLRFRDQFCFPSPLSELPASNYQIQAVLDRDLGSNSVGNGPGNGFSEAFRLAVDPKSTGKLRLLINHVVPARQFKETNRIKLFEMESKLLSEFHKKPMKLRAGVVLPSSFDKEPNRKYPVLYDVPGFGGDHFAAFGISWPGRLARAGEEMIVVALDPECRTGHHVFADSANNGPYGKALVEEFIPTLEKQFRGINKPAARFVTGHSSGGWSSLWLQVTYPDFFGGCWSTAPDPVDFHDFQRINLYAPGANMFVDEKGEKRGLARGRGGNVAVYYKPFSDMEVVLGHGGQLFSFEAVFSPKGPDGQPLKLWNRDTGAIDATVAKSWEPYDINLVLKKNWPTLAPKLKGKVHVYMGDQDTFFLEGATRLLQGTLKELGSDAKVELFPGKDHGSLLSGDLMNRIATEMVEQYRKGKGGA